MLSVLVEATVGLLIGAALVAVIPSSDLAEPSVDDSRVVRPGDAAAFLAAWRRSREGTWAVTARFERETAGGERVEAVLRQAQRPPDRFIDGFGSVEARRGDRRLRCLTPTSTETSRCSDAGPAPLYATEVDEELARLERIVAGDDPLYAVRGPRGSCFELRLILAYPSPPYGERARFCFDPGTGAPTDSEVHRREGRDARRVLDVRPDVTSADLAPI